ncbi:MAG: co-chaperone GroES [Candidatus Zipacnadales bacterium]
MLKPLGGRVLVKPLESETTSSGGIILPDSAQKRPQEGEVIAVGEGKMLDSGEIEPIPVAVGDIVVYPEYGGTEIKVDDVEYLLIDSDSILAVRIEDEKAKKKSKKS